MSNPTPPPKPPKSPAPAQGSGGPSRQRARDVAEGGRPGATGPARDDGTGGAGGTKKAAPARDPRSTLGPAGAGKPGSAAPSAAAPSGAAAGGTCAECGAPVDGATCKYCNAPTTDGPAPAQDPKGQGKGKAAAGAAAGAAASKAANAAASEFGPNVVDSANRVKDARDQARAKGGSGRGAAAAAVATEAGAELASKVGVPKSVVRKGVKALTIAAAALVGVAGFLLIMFLAAAAIQGPSPARAFPSHSERTNTGEPRIAEHQRTAAAANEIPPGIVWALSLAATENGKFSPYSEDTIDRDPETPGVRRSSAGQPAGGTPGETAAAPTTTAAAPAPAQGGSVAIVGDSLCEPGAAGDAIRSELEAKGLTVASADCVRGRPLAGDGEEALRSVGGVSTVVVSLGTNDLPGGDAAAFGQRVRGVLSSTPGVSFVWINFAASKYGDAAAAFNAELNKIASESPMLSVADVAAAVAANPEFQAADGVHLTGAGYSARAKAAADTASGSGGGKMAGNGTWPPNPADVEVSVWSSVTPAIGDPATQPAGPYLIQPRALAGTDVDAQAFNYNSADRPRTATELIVSELAQIREALERDGMDYDIEDEESMKEFWTEAVSRLPVADPRSVECDTPDRGPAADATETRLAVATAITDLWYCEIGNAEAFHTLTGVSRNGDEWTDRLGASAAALAVTREAAQVAWAYSEWGTAECDDAADIAGVFPLTKATFDAYATDADKSKGRCDTNANIRAAARAYIATEKVTPGERADGADPGGIGDRSTDTGEYAPMIGGWIAMPWALGGTDAIAEFARTGPASQWEPSDTCTQQIDAWLAGTASDDDTWADGVGATDSAPACDSPGGGGADDPAWVAFVAGRASAAAAGAEEAVALAGNEAWAAEQERETGVDPDDSDSEDAGDGPDEEIDVEDSERRAANLRGVAARLGGSTDGRPVLGRVTTNGVAPTDMPPLLEVDRSESGEKPYAEIVVELAHDLGGLVPGEGLVYDDPEADPLQILSEFQLQPPGGFGGGAFGALGGEIPYADIFNAAGNEHGVDPRLLAAVAYVESGGFSPDVIECSRRSVAGAQGIMQFMPDTAKGFGIDPCKPNEAIPAAAKYLKGLYEMFDGDWILALAGYNAGQGNVRKYGGVPPFAETRAYVQKVPAKWEEYKQKFPDQIPVGPIGGGGNFATVPGGRMVNTATRGQVCVVPIPSSPGTIVNCNIAGAVEAMYQHAARDGIVLKGGAHRPVEIQIQLRQQRCPGRVYDRSCKGSPPTAVPGRSMHETGEAIDITYGGSIINSRSSPAFQWLAANAAQYGLINLPSEPWHWSTNGN